MGRLDARTRWVTGRRGGAPTGSGPRPTRRLRVLLLTLKATRGWMDQQPRSLTEGGGVRGRKDRGRGRAGGRASQRIRSRHQLISSSRRDLSRTHARLHAWPIGRRHRGASSTRFSVLNPPIPEPPESGQMRSSDPASESHAAAGTNQCTWTSARVRRAHTSAC